MMRMLSLQVLLLSPTIRLAHAPLRVPFTFSSKIWMLLSPNKPTMLYEGRGKTSSYSSIHTTTIPVGAGLCLRMLLWSHAYNCADELIHWRRQNTVALD